MAIDIYNGLDIKGSTSDLTVGRHGEFGGDLEVLGGDIKFASDITYGPFINTGSNGFMSVHFGGNNNQRFEFWDHNTSGGAGIKQMSVGAAGINISGGFSHQKSNPKTINHSSGVFAIDFAHETNHYICAAANSSSVDHSFTFANMTNSIGQQGTIIINNPNEVGNLTWASPALPNTGYTPGGSAITFNVTANKIAVITYFVISNTKVLINYVGNFSSYPQ